MRKTLAMLTAGVVIATSGISPAAAAPARAAVQLQEGVVLKARGFPDVYYLGPGGRLYVFPNDRAYLSWYGDFADVVEVDLQDLARLRLAGNVPYRPGSLLVKVPTHPNVYAVAGGGQLRLVASEAVAAQLYGSNWRLLVDDLPIAFFSNYTAGQPVTGAADFDPDDEERRIVTISGNLNARGGAAREEPQLRQQLSPCERAERQVNKIQQRLQRRGITVAGIGDEFFRQCVQAVATAPVRDDDDEDEDDEAEDRGGRRGRGEDNRGPNRGPGREQEKISVCHIPPGNPNARHTITVGVPAAAAHLAHGDTLGPCPGETPADRQPPVLTELAATTTAATTAAITWRTDEPSTSRVVFATSRLATATTTWSLADRALVTSHAVLLAGLTADTRYFFRAESKDGSGNLATSTEMSFTTPRAAPAADATPPVISQVTATTTSATSAAISWTTNEPATSEVVYARENLATATTTLSIMDAVLMTAHALTLPNLATSTPYFFRVESRDGSGNLATSTPQTFTTAP